MAEQKQTKDGESSASPTPTNSFDASTNTTTSTKFANKTVTFGQDGEVLSIQANTSATSQSVAISCVTQTKTNFKKIDGNLSRGKVSFTVLLGDDNQPVIWGNRIRNQLTWDFKDIHQDSIRNLIKKALNEIEAECNVTFPRAYDDPLFIFRLATMEEEQDPSTATTLAYAFFPNSPVKEVVIFKDRFLLYPNNYGVILHEILHILGCRHEHPWEDMKIGKPTEDMKDAMLLNGVYDKDSIMNYYKLKDDKKNNKTTHLSVCDKQGLREMYGISTKKSFFLDL